MVHCSEGLSLSSKPRAGARKGVVAILAFPPSSASDSSVIREPPIAVAKLRARACRSNIDSSSLLLVSESSSPLSLSC